MRAVPAVAGPAHAGGAVGSKPGICVIIIIIIIIIIIYILCARGVALVNTKPFLHLVSSYGELELGGGNTAQSLTHCWSVHSDKFEVCCAHCWCVHGDQFVAMHTPTVCVD